MGTLSTGGGISLVDPVVSNKVQIKKLSDLPTPTLEDGVETIKLGNAHYVLNIDISSRFPLALPGDGNRATWEAVNGSKYEYTGPDACWRDRDAEGDVEFEGQVEFTAVNGNMFDILAVTGSWSFQGVTISRFRDCKSLGTVSGGAGGNGGFNHFFGSFSGFSDGLIMENLFFAEENTMFVDGNDTAKIDYDGQTTNFTVGETVTGGTSGATGVVDIDTDAGASGTLVLSSVVGTFQNDEALTGSSTGIAVVDGVLQNVVMFTVQGTATSGSINFLTLTFFAKVNQTLFNFKTEIQAGISSINLRGNQNENITSPSVFAPGSLTQKSLKVFSNSNTFFPNSKVIGSSFVSGNATATTGIVNGTFKDIDFGTLSSGSNIERFTVTNTTNGEMRCDSEVEFSGEITMASDIKSTGGSQVFRTKYVIKKVGQPSFVDLTDIVMGSVQVGSTLSSTGIVVPVVMEDGDLIKPQTTRVAGTSTVTYENYSMSIK